MSESQQKKQTFSIKARLQSFKPAFCGLRLLFRTQHNAWIHSIAMFLVITAGFYVDISRIEWLFVIIAIALVLITEALNSGIEALADSVTLDYNPHIKKAKDLAAGAVLLSAIAAVIIGLFIFLPYIF